MATKRKYIESHWLIYALQGVISLLFGWFVMFTGNQDTKLLTTTVGVTLLGLSIVETINLLHRRHINASSWPSFVMAVTEVIIASALLFTLEEDRVVPLAIIALYTIGRGALELLLSFFSIKDNTDRFMWIVCGICGCVIGFVVLNSGHFVDTSAFIKFFGTYMMIYGITNLFYGIHNKNELAEADEEKREAIRARKNKANKEKAAQKSKKSSAKKAKK